jgi:hypothetical protein
MLATGGELKDLKCQDRVKLTDAEIVYVADFTAWDVQLNQQVWYEAKGFQTPEWKIKLRLWRCYGPGILRIYMGSAKSFKMHEEVIPRTISETE